MRSRKLAILFIVVVTAAVTYAGPRRIAVKLGWWTIDGGGGRQTAGDFELTGTIGQPDAGEMVAGEYSLVGGFYPGPSLLESSDPQGPTVPGQQDGVPGGG